MIIKVYMRIFRQLGKMIRIMNLRTLRIMFLAVLNTVFIPIIWIWMLQRLVWLEKEGPKVRENSWGPKVFRTKNLKILISWNLHNCLTRISKALWVHSSREFLGWTSKIHLSLVLIYQMQDNSHCRRTTNQRHVAPISDFQDHREENCLPPTKRIRNQ